MRSTLLVLSGVGAALAAQGYLKLDLQRDITTVLDKRQVNTNDLDQKITASEKKNLYWLNLTVGTPPQPFRLQLDTGSSDLVLTNSKNSECSKEGGCPSGSFNPSDSSTYELVVQDGFNDSYGDGTAYIGDWFTDVLNVGGIEVKREAMPIGLANQLQDGPVVKNDGSGLVGIGHQALSGFNLWTEGGTNSTLAPTLVSAMVDSGDINRQAYSLFLGSVESGEGSVVFGGVEPALYEGELIAVPMVQVPNRFADYTRSVIPLTSVGVTDLDGTRSLTADDFAIPVLLDSGATVSYLPSDVVKSIYAGFGARELEDFEFLPCARAQANVSLSFQFGGNGGPVIKIPLSALMQEFTNDAGKVLTFDDGQDACFLKLKESPAGERVVLGDSFLRSGYVVYDLENNVIALAQAAASPSKGDVTAIPIGTEIPGCSSTVTFTLDPTSATVQSEEPPVETTSVSETGSFLPATATFDIGAASTLTSVPSSSATGSGSASSSSSAGVALPVATMKAGMVLAAAMFGGVAAL